MDFQREFFGPIAWSVLAEKLISENLFNEWETDEYFHMVFYCQKEFINHRGEAK